MSLVPHGFFPRSLMDMDRLWHPTSGLTTLDMFDPFDELDSMISRNLSWLHKPEFDSSYPLMPRVPQKYRITVDVTGFSPNSIKTEVDHLKLKVHGKEDVKLEGGDYSAKEFKKTYTLPANAEPDKMVSFVTSPGQLVIEVPLKETDKHMNVDLFPRISDSPDGGKQVSMNFAMPAEIDPSKVTVSIKDRDVIVKADAKVEKPDGISRFHYYKRTTMPENTVFGKLKCEIGDNNQMSIHAPLDMSVNAPKTVPITYKQPPSIAPASSAAASKK